MDTVAQMIDDALRETEAEIEGHFRLRSGRCGQRFFQIARLARKPRLIAQFCRVLGERIAPYRPQVVVGPATGGIVIAHAVGVGIVPHLPTQEADDLDVLYFEKGRRGDDGKIVADPTSKDFYAMRGFDAYLPGRRTAVVEDALTTGETTGRVAARVRALGGTVVVVGAVIQRGAVRSSELEGVPVIALRRRDEPDWDPQDCPMHQAGIPYSWIPGKG